MDSICSQLNQAKHVRNCQRQEGFLNLYNDAAEEIIRQAIAEAREKVDQGYLDIPVRFLRAENYDCTVGCRIGCCRSEKCFFDNPRYFDWRRLQGLAYTLYHKLESAPNNFKIEIMLYAGNTFGFRILWWDPAS